MKLDYFTRLLVISLASLFILHVACGAIVSAMAPTAMRFAERLRACEAARFLLLVRFFPLTFAFLITAFVLVPSYLQYEPAGFLEPVSLVWVAAAALCVLTFTLSLTRGLQALRKTRRYLREADLVPPLFVAGVFRPQIVVTPEALSTLSADELAVALRHEGAHCAARENLKRLLFCLAPGLFPGLSGFTALERAWARFAEWAADDVATANEPAHAALLAMALVRVSRQARTTIPSLILASLLPDPRDLAARVDRLLRPPAVRPEPSCWRSLRFLVETISVCVFSALLLVYTPVLLAVHELLERVIR